MATILFSIQPQQLPPMTHMLTTRPSDYMLIFTCGITRIRSLFQTLMELSPNQILEVSTTKKLDTFADKLNLHIYYHLGQILTLFGQNWYHENIAPLFSALSARNYKIIYLSARSICQTDHTRNLLKNINQSTFRMPKGPLLLNPNQLFSSIHNEIIPAKIDEKLISLQNIRSLFGATRNPFYAGFGNKLNDFIVYRNVDINEKSIFIVSKNGKINGQTNREVSYSIILNEIDDFFPNNCCEIIK